MRIFVAIDLDPEIKKNISRLINELDTGQRNIRWIKHQGMHLTLKFLGEVSGDKATRVESVLRTVIQKYHPFFLNIKGTGTFPPAKKIPKVLWLGVEENKILKALQSEIDAFLESLGFPKEAREYHPHLTLGRVKSPFNIDIALAELDRYRQSSFGEMKVNKITLFKSTLKPSGAEYTVISEFVLK